ncbi:ABC transporter permease [Levyella massiliensis]|uniref:ABC transporter permease n=1 Tax=Levyella massiliensis TaxID=938289 RepID=UPI0023EF811F|nr:ABC transporter permease [Levyella massiliensis]
MAKYIITRLIKSVISVLVVVSIVVLIVYQLVPKTRSFLQDTGYQKMQGNPKTVYYYGQLESLGYLQFVPNNKIFSGLTKEEATKDIAESPAKQKIIEGWKSKGYTVEELKAHDALQGEMIAYRYYNSFELIGNFFRRLFVLDHKNYIQDPNNPNLERGYRIERDQFGVPALVGSGTLHKYMIYFDGNFPFIHQNFLTLNFGESFPTHKGVMTLDVITKGQGDQKKIKQTFPTGVTLKSPIDQHSLKYKYNLDVMDQKRFNDHYADGTLMYTSMSMVGMSYFFGIFALLITYAVSLPIAVAMARKPGGIVDKIGIGYINLLISLPSLAFIFFLKYIGVALGLPDLFPHLGFNDPRSYILPMVILGLLSTPSLMMWVRRYMVDQSTADYVKFAKAKGLSGSEISRRHILKNAIIPVVNGIPSSVILAISGAVLTESVFSIPGMGKMLPDAIKAGNNNMVITLTFIFTALSIAAVFIGDLLMTVVDPRISLQEKKEGGR